MIMKTNDGLFHDSVELRRLIAENPDLPIIVCAGEYANIGEYGYEYCGKVYCSVETILDCILPFSDRNGNDPVYDDKSDFEEDMTRWLEGEIPNIAEISDEDFGKRVKEEIAKYEPYWRKAIVISVNN